MTKLQMERLVSAAYEIRRLRDVQREKTKLLQELARDARRTGRDQSHRIPMTTVVNFEDAINALCNALPRRKEAAC